MISRREREYRFMREYDLLTRLWMVDVLTRSHALASVLWGQGEASRFSMRLCVLLN